jgi:hypothetical protein
MTSPVRSAKARWWRAFAIAAATALVSLALLKFTHSRLFVLPLMGSAVGFLLWRAQFTCPRCGAPYLFDTDGFIARPRRLGAACRQCGLPTNRAMRPEDEAPHDGA